MNKLAYFYIPIAGVFGGWVSFGSYMTLKQINNSGLYGTSHLAAITISVIHGTLVGINWPILVTYAIYSDCHEWRLVKYKFLDKLKTNEQKKIEEIEERICQLKWIDKTDYTFKNVVNFLPKPIGFISGFNNIENKLLSNKDIIKVESTIRKYGNVLYYNKETGEIYGIIHDYIDGGGYKFKVLKLNEELGKTHWLTKI
jgi:hypothetical protein